MSVRVKGGMYCPRCRKPVAGQKSTHRALGAIGLLSGLFTLAIPGDYHCPSCGGQVVSEATGRVLEKGR